MNNITIAGNLGKDAVLKQLASGPLLEFSVADSQGREKPTIWWDCALFGKRAETLQQYMQKGQQVSVSGSVALREYQAKDGTPRKAMSIRIVEVALQGGKQAPQQAPQQAAPRQAPPQVRPPQSTGSGFDDMDNDIPF